MIFPVNRSTPRVKGKVTVTRTEMWKDRSQSCRDTSTSAFASAVERHSISQNNIRLEAVEDFMNSDFCFSGLLGSCENLKV